jgi:hypothetical protein
MPPVDDAAFARPDTGQMDGNQCACVHNLLKVSVGNLIQMPQTANRNTLNHLIRALLYDVHNVFPQLDVTGHLGHDPVLLKKLMDGEGMWDVHKEILGWMIDGTSRCIKITDGQ